MNITQTQMTAQRSIQASGLGMPSCGHGSDLLIDVTTGRIGMFSNAIEGTTATASTTGGSAIAVTTGTVARDRRGAVVLGYAEKPFPGTRAWRPPSR